MIAATLTVGVETVGRTPDFDRGSKSHTGGLPTFVG
jgi:hypothetical protein